MTESRGTKTFMGIGAILNSIVLAGSGLPYPFNFITLAAVATLGIGIVLDWKDVI